MKLTCKARSCLSGMIFGTANGPFSPGRVCNEENSTLRAKIVDPKKKNWLKWKTLTLKRTQNLNGTKLTLPVICPGGPGGPGVPDLPAGPTGPLIPAKPYKTN